MSKYCVFCLLVVAAACGSSNNDPKVGTGGDAAVSDSGGSTDSGRTDSGQSDMGPSADLGMDLGVDVGADAATDGGDEGDPDVNVDSLPVLTITEPAADVTILEGEPLTLSGTATDAEDGDLSAAIVWTSDVDGEIGIGAAVIADLSIGTHAVTAEVFDSAGGADNATVTVTVDPLSFPTTQYGTPEDERIGALAMTPDRHLYLAGNSRGDFGGTNMGERDLTISRIAPDGTLLWTVQQGSIEYDTFDGVATGPSDEVVAVGLITGQLGNVPLQGQVDGVVAKYDKTGTEIFTRRLATAGNDDFGGVDIASDGSIYVAGRTTDDFTNQGLTGGAVMMKLSPTGTPQWTEQFAVANHGFTDVTVDAQQDVIFVGRDASTLFGANIGGTDGIITKRAPNGDEIWSQRIGSTTLESSIAVDTNGAMIAVGFTTDGVFAPNAVASNAFEYDIAVALLNPDGSEVWRSQHSTIVDSVDGIVLADSGRVFVVGDGSRRSTEEGGWVAAFDSDGTFLWLQRLDTSRFTNATGAEMFGSLLMVSGQVGTQLPTASNSFGGNDWFITTFPQLMP